METKDIAQFIKKRLGMQAPKTAIILGSGLDSLINIVENKAVLRYSDMTHFPDSSVEGHKGELIYGKVAGKEVLFVNGRVHLYEGYNPHTGNFFPRRQYNRITLVCREDHFGNDMHLTRFHLYSSRPRRNSLLLPGIICQALTDKHQKSPCNS